MAGPESPLWKRVFDDVERRVGGPLAAATSSTEFQSAAMKLRKARSAVVAPIRSVAGFGLHAVGLPSHQEVRQLRRELNEVQREMLAIRREEVQAERDAEEAE